MDEAETRAVYDRIAELESALANSRNHFHHEIVALVLKEMIRARYDHSHHTPEIVAKNVATAKAYADKLYPEAK